ncbi:MAG: DNA repair protein RadC [Bacteroidota bacterium]|nr:DNA repair protein RadC [Bacteroidota bacterium]MDP4205143.1 DNA repair protein RadC [Bacteroidota bacterium]
MPEYQKLSIKEWALEDRPREKLKFKGLPTLSDAELLAIIIGSGTPNESAVDLSKRIMSEVHNNLSELGKLELHDYNKFKGIGDAKAIRIIAALELGRRRRASALSEKQKITSSRDVAEIFQSQLGDLAYEEFWVLFLDRANKIIQQQKISQGGISGTITDVRIILKKGVEILASSLILIHNHPSGNCTPSDADCKITNKIKEAGQILDIPVLDHIIVGSQTYYSFADEGQL